MKQRSCVSFAVLLLLASSCQGELSTDPFDDNPESLEQDDYTAQSQSVRGSNPGRALGHDKKKKKTDAAECGNGVVDPGETCDAKCPVSCNDYNACTTDVMVGSPYTCDAECRHDPVVSCTSGDGCCPPGCDSSADGDCDAACGNGLLEAPETCDGDCPTQCNDGDRCTADYLAGGADTCDAECVHDAIVACVDGDGCCAPGCDATTDADCMVQCGNGVVEPGETCDPATSCPTIADCDDGDACTSDGLVGSAATCDAACMSTVVSACLDGDGCCPSGCTSANDDDCSAACGNGLVEPGESCDGDCPSWRDCQDGDACTTNTVVGSASSCTAMCDSTQVTSCSDGDGCCPSACNAGNDDDCGVVPLDCTDPATWPPAWTQLEDEIFAETNRRRTDPSGHYCGSTYYPPAGPLNFDARLREAARCHVLDMITNNFFSHTGSDGSKVGTRVDRAGYNWRSVGENLAAGNETAPLILDQWMGSESHCRNVMKATYEDLGVGYAYSTDTTYYDYSAQVFGTEF